MRVAVSVSVVRVAVDDLGHRRLAAAIDRRAVGDLDLDRRVVNAEVIAELVGQPFENRSRV